MVLLIVSILVLAAALVLALYGRKRFAVAAEARSIAEDLVKLAGEARAASQAARDETKHERELAGALLAHVQKIEDSLTCPRFALDLVTGRFRALPHNEEPDLATEVNAAEPDPDCKKCYGRGWDGRRRETGRVIPCVCVKRPAWWSHL